MTDEKEDILSKLETLIKILNETAPVDLTLENIIAELEDIRAKIKNNLE